MHNCRRCGQVIKSDYDVEDLCELCQETIAENKGRESINNPDDEVR